MPRVYDFFSMKYIYFQDPTTKDIKADSLLRALQSIEYTNEIEAVKNIGGDAAAPWMIEPGQPDPSLSMVVTELRAGLYNVAEDVTVTTNAAETGGSIGAIANTNGTSIVDATTGIASVAIKAGEEAAIQAGVYIFKYASATTVDVYGASLANNITEINNLIAAGVVVPGTGGTIDVDEAGITITGGSGSIAFTTGDIGVCENVRPINEGSNIIVVGSSQNPLIVSAKFIQPKQTTGDIYYIDVPKLFLPGGLPWGSATREFSELTINGSPLVADDGSVYTITQILASSDS